MKPLKTKQEKSFYFNPKPGDFRRFLKVHQYKEDDLHVYFFNKIGSRPDIIGTFPRKDLTFADITVPRSYYSWDMVPLSIGSKLKYLSFHPKEKVFRFELESGHYEPKYQVDLGGFFDIQIISGTPEEYELSKRPKGRFSLIEENTNIWIMNGSYSIENFTLSDHPILRDKVNSDFNEAKRFVLYGKGYDVPSDLVSSKKPGTILSVLFQKKDGMFLEQSFVIR